MYQMPYTTARAIADAFIIAKGSDMDSRQEFTDYYPRIRAKDGATIEDMYRTTVLTVRRPFGKKEQEISLTITERSNDTVQVCDIRGVREIWLVDDEALHISNDDLSMIVAVSPRQS